MCANWEAGGCAGIWGDRLGRQGRSRGRGDFCHDRLCLPGLICWGCHLRCHCLVRRYVSRFEGCNSVLAGKRCDIP